MKTGGIKGAFLLAFGGLMAFLAIHIFRTNYFRSFAEAGMLGLIAFIGLFILGIGLYEIILNATSEE